MVSKISAMAISSLLIVGMSLALSGCLGDPAPEMKMHFLEDEYHDEDAEGVTAEDDKVFCWSKIKIENKDDSLEQELDEDNFILETVDEEFYKEKEEEAEEDEYLDIPDEEINIHEEGQSKDMPDIIGPGESAEFWMIFEIPEDDIFYSILYPR